ncbi:hypothetical protein E1B28_013305 [Marasmius oreades]|uniref:Uncharacterized protein n=1 Tax=Marasmius oreades TaxID=181124 RepID=A0A9P7RPK6_9AGAR|nr:uncharacterized protein E1B28_013305 [Marasmius oreades]KAG7087330.1 hypothetical protein E1B28_013305 [Marasmius oreades]
MSSKSPSCTQASGSNPLHESRKLSEEAEAAAKRYQDECIEDLTAPWYGNTYPTYDAIECLLAGLELPPNAIFPPTPTPTSAGVVSKPKGPPPIDPNRPLLFQPLQTLPKESWEFYEEQEALDRQRKAAAAASTRR